ncbi:MAG: DUF4412 domain-containing protein [candidate division KSB1 bacterium]|nr:DUF4412 domain-containing protein [candidate division KSB1 bacterium]
MRLHLRATAIVLALSLFLMGGNQIFAQKSFEGYWEQTTVTTSDIPMGPKSETKAQQVFYKPGKFKILDVKTGDMIIFRLDKELFWNVNKPKGTYTEITFAQMEQATGNARKAFEEHMKDLSPEERAQMEKMMGGKLGDLMGLGTGESKLTLKKTGKTEVIGGYNCEQWVMMSGATPLMELWVTPKFSMGQEFMQFYQKSGLFKGELPKELEKLNGLAMKTHVSTDIGMGRVESTTTVSKITPTSVSDKEFELPPGLKKEHMPMPGMHHPE